MDLNVYRLSAVIFNLREKGWPINTERAINPDTGNGYAKYRLA